MNSRATFIHIRFCKVWSHEGNQFLYGSKRIVLSMLAASLLNSYVLEEVVGQLFRLPAPLDGQERIMNVTELDPDC